MIVVPRCRRGRPRRDRRMFARVAACCYEEDGHRYICFAGLTPAMVRRVMARLTGARHMPARGSEVTVCRPRCGVPRYYVSARLAGYDGRVCSEDTLRELVTAVILVLLPGSVEWMSPDEFINLRVFGR